jgi:hypothetical protein
MRSRNFELATTISIMVMRAVAGPGPPCTGGGHSDAPHLRHDPAIRIVHPRPSLACGRHVAMISGP